MAVQWWCRRLIRKSATILRFRQHDTSNRFHLQLEPLEDRCLFATSLAYDQIPLSFEMNQGQTDAPVDFLAHGAGYGLFLSAGQAVLSLQKVAGVGSAFGPPALTSTVLDMQLVGANPAASVTGLDPLATVSNYFVGNDPSQWHVNVPNFGQVEYENIYSGVNLIYYGNQRQLEYDFVVAPGANPGVIRLAFQGADSLGLDGQGNLVLHTAGGDVLEHAPILYQDMNGVRQAVAGQFILLGNGQVGFDVGAYDKSRPLVIDPVLSYSTFLGGSGDDQGLGIAVDASGNAYLTGWTASTNFPTVNPLQGINKGAPLASNVFVAKLNAAGTALVYSTYLGGTGTTAGDEGLGIAVDSSGDAYVTGFTFSTDFPTAGNPVQLHYGGNGDAFVAKLNATGSSLVYSTYLGGAGQDEGSAIAVDSSGNAYITGYTMSANFPTANAFQATNKANPGKTAFVSKLNSTGSALVYSTYLGGSIGETGLGIAVDGSGNAYVTGTTSSSDFPTANALQGLMPGSAAAFVTKFNASGSALVYSTFLGGSAGQSGNAIAVDGSGNAYVVGNTSSTDFPTANAFQSSFAGGNATGDVFVTKLNAAGSALVYSTYLGGSGNDQGTGIALDSSGNAYVTGFTSSTNFPTANAIQAANAGGAHDAFVAKLSASGSALSYSTYLGGSGDDQGTGIAVDGSGNAYVIGFTTSANFPTAHALQSSFGGGTYDAFVAKIGTAVSSSLHFVVTAPSTAVAGTPFTITVTAEDSNNHIVTSYTGTVHFSSSDGFAGLPANYTFTATDAGVHTFTNGVTLQTSASQTVTAKDTSNSSITGSATISVSNPAPAITSLGQTSAAEGSSSISLTVNGAGLVATSIVEWNGAALATTFVNNTQVKATVPAADLAEEGSANVTVVNPAPGGGTSGALAFAITDAGLTAGGVAISATEGSLFSGRVATFTDANSKAPLSDFTTGSGGTVIDWGDGTATSAGTISQPGGLGTQFVVSGSHTYADEGSYTITITITDKGGSSSQTTATATTGDASLTASGVLISATQGVLFSGQVASFTDANLNASVSDFTSGSGSVKINWGDGTPTTTGTLTQPGGVGTPFIVSGSHAYLTPGSHTVIVTITDKGGSLATARSTAGNMHPAGIIGRDAGSGNWWVGTSTGTSFSTSLWATWSPAISWVDVQTGDFNGDGHTDIIGRDVNSGQWWVGISNGSTGFRTTMWGAWSPTLTWVDVHVGDFNGDGKADIIGRALQTGQWWVGISTGTSFTTSLWATWSPTLTWVDVHVGDFTGGGKADIIGRALESGQWWVGSSTGTSFSTSLWATWSPTVTWVDVQVGDFNGDGKADITGRVLQSGQWWTGLSTGSSFVTTLWDTWSPGVTWVDVKVGDFNGDGKDDIIGRILQSGDWWVGQSTGSGFTNALWGNWSAAFTWVDVQVGDFNADGRDDLTARMQVSGQWWTALSTGSSFTSTLWATWSPSVNWVNVMSGAFV